MTYQFTVSPDFAPDLISSWFVFNTWLQNTTNDHVHLELYDDFVAQRAAVDAGKVDLIYANPYDAAMLVREKGFVPIAKPVAKPDEAVVAVPEESPAHDVEDLVAGTRIVSTDDPDVNMMGMIMLEPAQLDASNTESRHAATYVLVAKALINGDADVGFFLKEAFDKLSGLVRRQLRTLVTSQIHVISHCLLAGPELADDRESLQALLVGMTGDPKGASVVEGLGFSGWEPVELEEMEFMIDLMDTLVAD